MIPESPPTPAPPADPADPAKVSPKVAASTIATLLAGVIALAVRSRSGEVVDEVTLADALGVVITAVVTFAAGWKVRDPARRR